MMSGFLSFPSSGPSIFIYKLRSCSNMTTVQEAMVNSIQLNMKLLLHTSTCHQPEDCQSLNCRKMKVGDLKPVSLKIKINECFACLLVSKGIHLTANDRRKMDLFVYMIYICLSQCCLPIDKTDIVFIIISYFLHHHHHHHHHSWTPTNRACCATV